MKHRHKAIYGTKSGGGSTGQKVAPEANNSYNGNVETNTPRKKSFGSTKCC